MIEAKKVLGQNFLIDKNKINEIVDSIPKLTESVILEVGPGQGAITKPLLEKAKKVIAIEIDKDMVEIIKKSIVNENLKLINEDILNIKWNDILKGEKNIQFVSNLPYYISTKIMFKVAYDERFESMSVMLQSELVDRIFAKSGSKLYGRLTVSVNSIFDLIKKINVPSGCFKPKPNVDSGFIVLKRKKINFDIDSYLTFIKHSFSMKRKTFLNSLKKSGYKNFEKVKEFLIKNNINLSIRAEEINVEKFIEIFNNID